MQQKYTIECNKNASIENQDNVLRNSKHEL